jgi:hypothetical protein
MTIKEYKWGSVDKRECDVLREQIANDCNFKRANEYQNQNTSLVLENGRLKKELEETKAEIAACLEFMSNEMCWEGFREEMLYAEDTKEANASKQNMIKLSTFLKKTGRGIKIMKELKALRKVAQSGLQHDKSFTDMVVVQIDRATWDKVRESIK